MGFDLIYSAVGNFPWGIFLLFLMCQTYFTAVVRVGHLLAGGTLDICQHGEVIPHTSKACQNLDDRGKHMLSILCYSLNTFWFFNASFGWCRNCLICCIIFHIHTFMHYFSIYSSQSRDLIWQHFGQRAEPKLCDLTILITYMYIWSVSIE